MKEIRYFYWSEKVLMIFFVVSFFTARRFQKRKTWKTKQPENKLIASTVKFVVLVCWKIHKAAVYSWKRNHLGLICQRASFHCVDIS
jgi:hypothetical protein